MKALDRLAARILRTDPTTACEWTEADEYDLATKYARLLFENATLKARVAEVEALYAKADQENAELFDTLTEHRLVTDVTVQVPRLHVVPSPRMGSHDDLPAADESWIADAGLFRDGNGRWGA